MKLLRTLSTPRLLVLLAVVALAATAGTAIAVASGGGGPKPAPKPLAQAIHDGLAAKAPSGLTARITFTNKLFPSDALTGDHASALMSGASGRLWVRSDGRGRLELQSSAGDVQIVWNRGKVTVYDASSNTVYRATLPQRKASSEAPDRSAHRGPPSASRIAEFLSKLRAHASVSAARPTDLGGQPAYNVVISPKQNGGLLGSAQLAWDAIRGVPLRVAIYAKGSSAPVLSLEAYEISYGPVPASSVDLTPPTDAKTVDLSLPTKSENHPDSRHSPAKQATGLRAVRALAGFPVLAPGTLAGRTREVVRSIGSHAVVVIYGHGLGAIAVVERKADANGQHQGALSNLPEVSLDGVTGHELATQLGTVIEWKRTGVGYVLAGSLSAAAAEAAARSFK
jgi:outer membrane lipoprotein-sorting protein